jgi:predicted ribosomally synthesized peptide with SipW-like signal peptide
MQRQMLRLTLILGVMVTLLGGTGVFAVFTDQANGGTNTVNSGALAKAADLHISPGTAGAGGVGCTQYADDTSTAQFTIQSFGAGSQPVRSYVCLKNVGSATLGLTAGAANLLDLDTSCTGDEAAAGDQTCGSDGAGELAPVVTVLIRQVNCQTLAASGGLSQSLDRWAAALVSIQAPTLTAGGIACIEFELRYGGSDTAGQLAQSDTVTWKFRFEGTAA